MPVDSRLLEIIFAASWTSFLFPEAEVCAKTMPILGRRVINMLRVLGGDLTMPVRA